MRYVSQYVWMQSTIFNDGNHARSFFAWLQFKPVTPSWNCFWVTSMLKPSCPIQCPCGVAAIILPCAKALCRRCRRCTASSDASTANQLEGPSRVPRCRGWCACRIQNPGQTLFVNRALVARRTLWQKRVLQHFRTTAFVLMDALLPLMSQFSIPMTCEAVSVFF